MSRVTILTPFVNGAAAVVEICVVLDVIGTFVVGDCVVVGGSVDDDCVVFVVGGSVDDDCVIVVIGGSVAGSGTFHFLILSMKTVFSGVPCKSMLLTVI